MRTFKQAAISEVTVDMLKVSINASGEVRAGELSLTEELSIYIATGRQDLVEFLLSENNPKKKEVLESINTKDVIGAAMTAIYRGYLDCLRILVKTGMNLPVGVFFDEKGNLPYGGFDALMMAIHMKRREIIEFLLSSENPQKQKIIDAVNDEKADEYRLELFRYSEFEDIKILSKAGLKLIKKQNIHDDLRKDLSIFDFVFSKKEAEEILQYLLGPKNPQQAEILDFIRSDSGVALKVARADKPKLLVILKAAGANFHFETKYEQYSVEVLRFLLSDQNPGKDTLIQSAWFRDSAAFNCVSSAAYLESLKVCVTMGAGYGTNENGYTPLTRAIYNKNIPAASFLVSANHPQRQSVIRAIDVQIKKGRDDDIFKKGGDPHENFPAIFLACADYFWDEKESLPLVGELSQAGAALNFSEANEKLVSSLRRSEFRIVALLLIGGAIFPEKYFDDVKGKRNGITDAIWKLAPQLRGGARRNQVVNFLREMVEPSEAPSLLHKAFYSKGLLERKPKCALKLENLYRSLDPAQLRVSSLNLR